MLDRNVPVTDGAKAYLAGTQIKIFSLLFYRRMAVRQKDHKHRDFDLIINLCNFVKKV